MAQQLRMPFLAQTDYELDAEENAAVSSLMCKRCRSVCLRYSHSMLTRV